MPFVLVSSPPPLSTFSVNGKTYQWINLIVNGSVAITAPSCFGKYHLLLSVTTPAQVAITITGLFYNPSSGSSTQSISGAIYNGILLQPNIWYPFELPSFPQMKFEISVQSPPASPLPTAYLILVFESDTICQGGSII